MFRYLTLLLPFLLSACENSGAAYMIGGDKNHAISLTREQSWFWSKAVTQRLVPSRFPVCQRRFDITPGNAGSVEIELYGVSDMLYVAHQGADWWAVGTEDCQVQKFRTPPPVPGVLLGTFRFKDGNLAFVPVPAR